jgi:hypothetical protein
MFGDQLVYIWIGCEIFMTYIFGNQLMYIWTDGEIEIFMTYMFGDQLVYIWIDGEIFMTYIFDDQLEYIIFIMTMNGYNFEKKKYTFNILLLNTFY